MLKTYPVTINIYSAANTVNKTGLPNAYKCIPVPNYAKLG